MISKKYLNGSSRPLFDTDLFELHQQSNGLFNEVENSAFIFSLGSITAGIGHRLCQRNRPTTETPCETASTIPGVPSGAASSTTPIPSGLDFEASSSRFQVVQILNIRLLQVTHHRSMVNLIHTPLQLIFKPPL